MSDAWATAPLRAGKFRIVDVLGQGGFAYTYKAFMDGYPGVLALKTLRSASEFESPAIARMAEKRFEREIELLRKVKSRHIAGIVDDGQINGQRYVVVEFCGGGTLAQMLRHHPAGRTLSDAAKILVDVCAGVAAAHAADVLHRDLNPNNVLLADSGDWKVCDFGMGRVADEPSSLTGNQHLPGVYDFSAPERYVAGSDNLDETYDVYSLGCLLYFVLTGRRPYASSDGHVDVAAVMLRHAREPVLQLAPSHTAAAANPVLAKAMAKDPRERYQSVPDMASHLRHVVGPSVKSDPQPKPRTPSSAAAEEALAAFDTLMNVHPDVARHRDAGRVRDGLRDGSPRSSYLGAMTIVDDLITTSGERIASEVLLWVFRAFPGDRETVRRMRDLGFALIDVPPGSSWPPRFAWDDARTLPVHRSWPAVTSKERT